MSIIDYLSIVIEWLKVSFVVKVQALKAASFPRILPTSVNGSFDALAGIASAFKARRSGSGMLTSTEKVQLNRVVGMRSHA